MAYQPIENYGIIRELRTTARVGTDGSIDWLCLPRFDSPSVFASILDDERGGRFRIAPTGDGASRKQFYWPDTNVLVTRFFTLDGVGEAVDYMPVVAQANDLPVTRGVVRWFDVEAGVETITSDIADDNVFFHFTAIPGEGYRTLELATSVRVEVVKSK